MDYEKLYHEVLKEVEEMKSENDDICNEYESTIKLLSDTVVQYKDEKKAIETKYNEIANYNKQMQADLKNYKAKNDDKMVDIELLNKQVDKLNSELMKAYDLKKLTDAKIVNLENDNEQYITKIRENQSIIDDLSNKLESAIEESISLQTDYHNLKQTLEEQLQRKCNELEDLKNEIVSKDIALQKAIINNQMQTYKNIRNNLEKSINQNSEDAMRDIMKYSPSKVTIPINNEIDPIRQSLLCSSLFITKEDLDDCATSSSKNNKSKDINRVNCSLLTQDSANSIHRLYEMNTFYFELLKQKTKRSLKETKGKLGNSAVEEIKKLLVRIQERKR